MAISQHVQWIKQGAEAWNKRRATRHFVPSLKNADLRGLNLIGVNLRGAQLSGARLDNVDMSEAILLGAHLLGANLSGSNLERAKLTAAVLTGANLRGANLRHAYLDECDFRQADLRECNLTASYIFGANLLRARTTGLVARSTDQDQLNLKYTRGIAQRQLDEMEGDTGIILPDDLQYPEHWPIWTDPNPSRNGNDGVTNVSDDTLLNLIHDNASVFISYSNSDRPLVATIRSILLVHDIPTWWDQDIPAGDSWRRQIDSNLSEATAVLTFWTHNSVSSNAVAEEAARAQRENKLVHAKLDDAALPYGFSETQYADLRGWDGTASHPEMRKLIQNLKDKISPPSPEEIQLRLTSAAPTAAVIENGRITAKDSPPTAAPPHPNDADLEQRLLAQETLARKVLSALQTLDNNLGEAIRFDLDHYIEQAQKRPASWYILTDSIGDLKFYLDMGEEFSWPGSTRNSLLNLLKGHEALRPRLQPQQPPANSSELPLPPPLPDPAKLSDDALKAVTAATNEAFTSAEAEDVLSEPALRVADYLAVEIDEARTTITTGVRSEEKKLQKIRKGLIALAGFVGTAIASISQGVGSNVLTSPDAAKTLVDILKRLFDAITALF